MLDLARISAAVVNLVHNFPTGKVPRGEHCMVGRPGPRPSWPILQLFAVSAATWRGLVPAAGGLPINLGSGDSGLDGHRWHAISFSYLGFRAHCVNANSDSIHIKQ